MASSTGSYRKSKCHRRSPVLCWSLTGGSSWGRRTVFSLLDAASVYPSSHPPQGRSALWCEEVGSASQPRGKTRLPIPPVTPQGPSELLFTFSLGTLVAGHTIQIQLDLYPFKAGRRQLQVLISSNEVKEIKGYKDIAVAAARAS